MTKQELLIQMSKELQKIDNQKDPKFPLTDLYLRSFIIERYLRKLGE